MSEEIIKVLDDLGEKFGIAIDWTSQNLTPYLQDLATRFISLKNAQAIVWIIISIITLVVSSIVIILAKRWVKKNGYDSYDDEYILAVTTYLIAGALIGIFTIVFTSNVFGLIQNIFIPELSIYEYIKILI